MHRQNVLFRIIQCANYLDQFGLYDEADELTSVANRVAGVYRADEKGNPKPEAYRIVEILTNFLNEKIGQRTYQIELGGEAGDVGRENKGIGQREALQIANERLMNNYINIAKKIYTEKGYDLLVDWDYNSLNNLTNFGQNPFNPPIQSEEDRRKDWQDWGDKIYAPREPSDIENQLQEIQNRESTQEQEY